MLLAAGAEICQLTDWQVAQGKGIDDYLINQLRSNGQSKPGDILTGLIATAKPFIDSVNPTSLDLDLVCLELGNVRIPGLLREQICKPLSVRLGVKVDDLRKIGAQRPGRPILLIRPRGLNLWRELNF